MNELVILQSYELLNEKLDELPYFISEEIKKTDFYLTLKAKAEDIEANIDTSEQN